MTYKAYEKAHTPLASAIARGPAVSVCVRARVRKWVRVHTRKMGRDSEPR